MREDRQRPREHQQHHRQHAPPETDASSRAAQRRLQALQGLGFRHGNRYSLPPRSRPDRTEYSARHAQIARHSAHPGGHLRPCGGHGRSGGARARTRRTSTAASALRASSTSRTRPMRSITRNRLCRIIGSQYRPFRAPAHWSSSAWSCRSSRRESRRSHAVAWSQSSRRASSGVNGAPEASGETPRSKRSRRTRRNPDCRPGRG